MERFIFKNLLRQLPNIPNINTTRRIIDNEYFQNTNQKDILVNQIIDFFTDVYFLAPLEKQIDTMASVGADIFYYVNEFNSYDIFGNVLLNRTTAAHGSDLLYLFGPTMYKKFFNIDFQSTIR